jgi:FkbM family methyltransferase
MNPEHVVAQSIVRSWPFRYGSGRLINRLFLGIKFEKPIETVSTSDGFQIVVDPNDLIGRHIYLAGTCDPAIIDVLRLFSLPQDTLLDIGANIGFVSASFLNSVRGSSVIAVEPQPVLLDLLRRNLSPFKGARIYPYALGDRDEVVTFKTDESNRGAGRISPDGEMQVVLRSAETMFSELEIPKINLVKIDAEGFEETIIRSLLPHLDRLRPRAIIFEDNAVSQAGTTLESIGYRLFGLRKYLHKITLEPTTGSASNKFHDYVALLHRDELPERAKRAFRTI